MNTDIELIRIDEYISLISKNYHHINQIKDICLKTVDASKVEGNCFYEHLTSNIKTELIPKQMNHVSLGKVSNNILEIGFNAGHSCLLYLIANPNSSITVFDLCYHKYTIPCFEYLQNKFPGRLSIIKGNSNETLPNYIHDNPNVKFDLIHIDGGHEKTIAHNDFLNSYKVASNLIIWDDTQMGYLNSLFEQYLSENLIVEVPMYRTFMYEHRIARKNDFTRR